jgi:phosphatidylinositol alpha-1,6-mannosyltransferase
MERLNHHVYLALRQRYETAVCGPAGSAAFVTSGDTGKEIAPSPLSRFLAQCQWHAWRMARQRRPEIVYSGSGLTAPAAWMAARSTGARAVSFLHGLDIVADHPIYRAFFLPAIRRCDRLLVNSSHTAGLAKAAGVPAERVRILHPGVTLPDWQKRAVARATFRERFGLDERPILLCAGRLTMRKGLAPFIRNTLPHVVREIPDTMLVVIGSEPDQALKHRAGITQEIKAALRDTALTDHVRLLGGVDDATLSQAYFGADLHVFPVLDLPGDVEGFGMVAVEAAAHGLPTVAFRVGGVIDAVADGKSGWLIPSGDYAGISARIIATLQGDRLASDLMDSCRAHAANFTWDIFSARLLEAIRG